MRSTAPATAELFSFRSLAVVGASPRNRYAGAVLAGLKSIGFEGDAIAVNPRSEPVHGFPACASLRDAPFPIEAAVIAIRADRVPEALEECAATGVRKITIVSAGFAEAGDDGLALQQRVAELAAAHGLLVCGPNCLGYASLTDRTSTYSRATLPSEAGPIAIVSHSGGMVNEILTYGDYRGLRFSKVVSAGNEAVIGLAAYLEAFVADEATTTIGIVVEGMREPDRLRAAFETALARGKPIVAIKIGSSALAAAAARTHTGALVGNADVFAALCTQCGVTLVEDLDALCESLLVFSRARRLIARRDPPRGFAAIEISGGGKGLVCDLAERAGLAMPPLAAPTAAAIAAGIESDVVVGNPLDLVIGWDAPASPPRHQVALEALAADGGYDVIASRVTVLPQAPIAGVLPHGELMRRLQDEHPDRLFVILSRVAEAIHPEWRAFCAESGVTYLQGYARGIRALGALARYRAKLAERDAAVPLEIRTASYAGIPAGAALLDEVAAKDLLASLGLPVNRTVFAESASAAVAAADRLGYPAVVKGIAPRASHKSERGLVKLNLRDAAAVRAAAEAILHELAPDRDAHGGRVGVSVQTFAQPGFEALVGTYRDETYGPVVVCGLGGVFAELLAERGLGLAPVTLEEARAMIAGTRLAAAGPGFRHLPAASTEPLARLVATVAAWVASDPRVAELDLNPVVLRGEEVEIVDARIVLG